MLEQLEEKVLERPKEKKYLLLFATYGTLRLNQRNWQWCLKDKSDYLGTQQTEPIYTMYTIGSFPAVAENGDTAITIDVFGTNDMSCIREVRTLEGYYGPDDYRNYYDAIKIKTEYGTAEMFVMNEAHFRQLKQIESGDWIEFITNK